VLLYHFGNTSVQKKMRMMHS